MSGTRPALEYLLACSDVSLESFRIARMNQAADLRKQVRALVDEWVEAEVDAGLSRCMLECRHTDAMPPVLEFDCPAQNRSPKHVTISLRTGRVAVSDVALRRQSLSIGFAEVEDAGGRLLLEDGTPVNRGHTKRLRKPYVKPFARRYVTSCLGEASIVAMPVRLSSKAQQEFEFELQPEGPLVPATEETPEGTDFHAAVERSSLSTEELSWRASRGLAKAHG